MDRDVRNQLNQSIHSNSIGVTLLFKRMVCLFCFCFWYWSLMPKTNNFTSCTPRYTNIQTHKSWKPHAKSIEPLSANCFYARLLVCAIFIYVLHICISYVLATSACAVCTRQPGDRIKMHAPFASNIQFCVCRRLSFSSSTIKQSKAIERRQWR